MSPQGPDTDTRATALERWKALSARERRLLSLAGLALVAAALWTWAVMPAWQGWREAPERLRAARAQWEQMQVMAAEASRMTAQAGASSSAPAPRGQSAGLDETTRTAVLRALGGQASLTTQGSLVVVEFNAAQPEGLRESLRTIRQRLKVRLVQAEVSPSDMGLKGRMRLEWTGP